MFENDLDHIVAVEVALASEEGLLGVIVVVVPILKLPVEPAHREPGERRCDRPAGECAAGLVDVLFSVVADAHREELKQLPAPVLVDGIRVVLVVVQPVDHGRVLSNFSDDVAELAHAHFAEHIDHGGDFMVVVHFGDAGGEDLMPEERHLLLERGVGDDHAVYPTRLADAAKGPRLPVAWVVAQELEDIDRLLLIGSQQLFDGSLVAGGRASFQLGPGSAEPGAPHQMGHQGDVISCHVHAPSCHDWLNFGNPRPTLSHVGDLSVTSRIPLTLSHVEERGFLGAVSRLCKGLHKGEGLRDGISGFGGA